MKHSFDFSKGKIYKVSSFLNPSFCYIGSTTCDLPKRYKEHTSRYLNYQKHFRTIWIIFEYFGLDNCSIQLLEDYPCKSKKELCQRENLLADKHIAVNRLFYRKPKLKDAFYNNKPLFRNIIEDIHPTVFSSQKKYKIQLKPSIPQINLSE